MADVKEMSDEEIRLFRFYEPTAKAEREKREVALEKVQRKGGGAPSQAARTISHPIYLGEFCASVLIIWLREGRMVLRLAEDAGMSCREVNLKATFWMLL